MKAQLGLENASNSLIWLLAGLSSLLAVAGGSSSLLRGLLHKAVHTRLLASPEQSKGHGGWEERQTQRERDRHRERERGVGVGRERAGETKGDFYSLTSEVTYHHFSISHWSGTTNVIQYRREIYKGVIIRR